MIFLGNDFMMKNNNQKRHSGTILVIDDDEDILFIVKENLARLGFKVITCTSGEKAIAIVDEYLNDIDIILLDILMPKMDGYETLKILRNNKKIKVIPIIMLTSVGNNEDRFKAYELGADDFIQKPFDELEIEIRIRSLLRIKKQQEKINYSNKQLVEKLRENKMYREIVKNTIDSIVLTDIDSKIVIANPAFLKLVNKTQNEIIGEKLSHLLICDNINTLENSFENILKSLDKNKSWKGELINSNKKQDWIASTTITPINSIDNNDIYGYVSILHDLSKVKELEKQLLGYNLMLKEANIETIYRLAYACELRDDDTGKHIKRIASFCYFLAKEMGFSDEDAEEISYSSMIHDVGKIKIPDSILKKPDLLTIEEREIIKMHTIYGEKMLGNRGFLAIARKIARAHHERWDGSGYPDKLQGEKIPITARITSIADVYDALTHERIYKYAWPKEEAYDYMVTQFGKQFDPGIKQIFVKLFKSGVFEEIEQKFNKENSETINMDKDIKNI